MIRIIVFLGICILYFVGISSVYHSMNAFNKRIRIIYAIVSLIIMMIITSILVLIGYKGNSISKKMMILIFTPINILISMPFIANNLSKCKRKKIEIEDLKKRIGIISIAFSILLIFECKYISKII